MRRVIATLALAQCLLVRGSTVLPWEPVGLLTDKDAYSPGCNIFSVEGQLLVDRTYGTAIIVDDDMGSTTPVPVMWGLGFNARRVGSEVEVLDPAVNVLATTGRRYRIAGGYASSDPRVFGACGYVIPH